MKLHTGNDNHMWEYTQGGVTAIAYVDELAKKHCDHRELIQFIFFNAKRWKKIFRRKKIRSVIFKIQNAILIDLFSLMWQMVSILVN
jgi:hypothetical protein